MRGHRDECIGLISHSGSIGERYRVQWPVARHISNQTQQRIAPSGYILCQITQPHCSDNRAVQA